MNEQKQHWESKLITGYGTLNDFAKRYDEVNGSPNQFATASQLFLIDKIEGVPVGNDTLGLYEFVIYYKVSPNANKTIDQTTGQIKQQPKLSLD